MSSVYVVLLLAVPWLGYEFYTLTSPDLWTISRAIMHMGKETLLVPYIFGVLPGHFHVQPPAEYTLAHYIPESGEVAAVVWIGWALFIFDLRYGFGFPWYGYVSVIWLASLIGAFCWTINV